MQENFNSDELLDFAVDAVLHESIADEPSPERIARLVAVIMDAAHQPGPITLAERIKSMKVRTRLVVAATALIALLGLMSWLAPGGGAIAFADVSDALTHVRSATWKTKSVTEVNGPERKTVTVSANAMFLAPSRERTETTAGGLTASGISIVDGQKNKAIAFVPATKTATVINFTNFPTKENPLGRTFQGLQELVASAQSGTAGNVRRLGLQTVDGHETEGFYLQVGSMEIKIWADPKTFLPVRVEEEIKEPSTKVVMTDFRFNVPLDETLFSVDLPPDYKVDQTEQIDASQPWAFLTSALKAAAEINGGVFPPTLQGDQGVVGVLQRGMQRFGEKRQDSPTDAQKLGLDATMNLAGLLGFIYATPPDALHYAGKDVKLGTPGRPILWLTPPRSGGRYLVIYADLTVKELSADELPKLPEPEVDPRAKEPNK